MKQTKHSFFNCRVLCKLHWLEFPRRHFSILRGCKSYSWPLQVELDSRFLLGLKSDFFFSNTFKIIKSRYSKLRFTTYDYKRGTKHTRSKLDFNHLLKENNNVVKFMEQIVILIYIYIYI